MGSLRFSLREHKFWAAYNPDFTFSKPSASVIRMTTPNASLGYGYIFIVVPREWLHGKYIRWNWQGYSSYPEAGHGEVKVWDGEYDRSSDTDFPSGSARPTKGAGLLQTLASQDGDFPAETRDVQVDTSGGTETKCTLFFELGDEWSAQNLWLQIDWVEFNTGAGGVGTLFDEQFTDSVTMEVTGTYGDYGYISTGEIVIAKPKPASIIPIMRVMDMISAAKPWSKRFPKFKPRLVA